MLKPCLESGSICGWILREYESTTISTGAPLSVRRRAAETATPSRPISVSTASEDRLASVA